LLGGDTQFEKGHPCARPGTPQDTRLKLTGNTDVTVWFLAMYLPEPAGWANAPAMIALGLPFT
jgi:hypothetical protein